MVASVNDTEGPSSSSSSDNASRRHVHFGQISIREHFIIMGDNPGGCSTMGPPLSIDWSHDDEVTFSIEDYESAHPQRRSESEMKVPEEERKMILKRNGYTVHDITVGTRPINLIRSQRTRTRQSLKLQPLTEAAESFSRTVLNVMTLGSRKRRERKFLSSFYVDTSNRTRETILLEENDEDDESDSSHRKVTVRAE